MTEDPNFTVAVDTKFPDHIAWQVSELGLATDPLLLFGMHIGLASLIAHRAWLTGGERRDVWFAPHEVALWPMLDGRPDQLWQDMVAAELVGPPHEDGRRRLRALEWVRMPAIERAD